LFNANNEIKIIGERHGEKLYETCAKEEMAKATDMGNFTKYLQIIEILIILSMFRKTVLN
jgi:FlaA1/EpsC-like NDP-sugar epimerase